MNTLLIIEPRNMDIVPFVIENFYDKVGWKVVFYCGKGLKAKWEEEINIPYDALEVRELDKNNFTPSDYNDFFKKKELWESLYGDYVIVFQTDAWCINDSKYNANFFIERKYSYIGGNAPKNNQFTLSHKYYAQHIFKDYDKIEYNNFNGGLSFRNRQNMIDVINNFPPKKTESIPKNMEESAEDVYFPLGCLKLGYKVGDDLDASHFALHQSYYDECFGIHKITKEIYDKINKKYPTYELDRIKEYICPYFRKKNTEKKIDKNESKVIKRKIIKKIN